jgi:hypothetical protein
MNVYQRLNEVRRAVDYAKKDKKVEGYMAVTHDQITALTRDHFVQQGIVIVPSIVSSKVEPTGTMTAKGTPFIRYEATYEFTVINADDPQDRFSGKIESHAIDHGDKAPGKALSYAKKSFVLKLLEIESGVDDEVREEQKPGERKNKITPNAGAGDDLTDKQKKRVADVVVVVKDCLSEGKEWDAYSNLELANFDVDEKNFAWAQLNSSERSAIRRMSDAERKKTQHQEKEAA